MTCRQLGIGLTIVAWLVLSRELPAQDDSQIAFFEKKIRPVLVEHCLECHGDGEDLGGGLRLDSRQGWSMGGASGPAIIPGQPGDSLLLRAISYQDSDLQMPPDARLPDAVIADFRQWIEQGAGDPRDAGDLVPTLPAPLDIAAGRKHWSYQLPAQPAVPSSRHSDRAINEIDAFVFARLEAAGLEPSKSADRVVLIRRLYFDLIGLPPTAEQIDAFVEDTAPDAYERLVDRLLASPHFGERWGRHWLDVVRYGESMTLRGLIFPQAWRYRDYVIEAFNQDRPFNQMVREQVAGDLLAASDLRERQRQCVATTFLAMGNWNLEEQDKPQLRMDVVDEQLEAIGRAFLAQTIGCARCHDHKFDPIPTADYYALAGILRSTKTLEHANVSKWLELPLPVAADEEQMYQHHEAILAELEKKIQETKEAAATSPEAANELKQLQAELNQQRAAGPKRPLVMSIKDEAQMEDARVHIRGTVHNLGPVVPRGFLQVANYDLLPGISPGESGRRELADWLASPRNPLTARVIVNRTWHWLFGYGLVRTPDNFGTTGESPSHPELLDHLALRFMKDGWSMKELIRSIVLSQTYRQSVSGSPDARSIDPENRLLSHANRRRLDAECLRDAMLCASGSLDLHMGGPSIAAGTTEDYGYQHDTQRRSVYMPVLRNALPDIFEAFDFADPSVVTGSRNKSTVAQQALYMMNHPFVHAQAQLAAANLLAQPCASEDERIQLAFRRILGRVPRKEEVRIAVEYLASDSDRHQNWTDLVQSLFGSLDFRYLY